MSSRSEDRQAITYTQYCVWKYSNGDDSTGLSMQVTHGRGQVPAQPPVPCEEEVPPTQLSACKEIAAQGSAPA